MKRLHSVPGRLAIALVASWLAAGQALGAAPGERIVRTLEGFSADRDAASMETAGVERRTDDDDVVRITKPTAAAPEATKGSATTLGSESGTGGATIAADHWIYDADAVLFDDLDGDGYFRYLSLRIDADSYLNRAYVYAVVYLSADGETWEELLATDDFLVTGSTGDDEYFVDAELVSGYPPGLYDVLIELYDADLGLYADEFGPAQSPALAVLPLEDSSYDQPVVIVTEHGGGATSPAFLGLLALYGLGRRLRKRAAIGSRGDRASKIALPR